MSLDASEDEKAWFEAFNVVCNNMSELREVFSLGEKDEYAEQVKEVKELLKKYGSFSGIYRYKLASSWKVTQITSNDLKPIMSAADYQKAKRAIKESLKQGIYPENEITKLIVTCAYGTPKYKKEAHGLIIGLCRTKKPGAVWYADEVSLSIERVKKAVPGICRFILPIKRFYRYSDIVFFCF
jgi:hypothetical protein